LKEQSLFANGDSTVKFSRKLMANASPRFAALVSTTASRHYLCIAFMAINYAIALNNQNQSITLVLPDWKNYQLEIATDPAILWNQSTDKLTLPLFGGVILLS